MKNNSFTILGIIIISFLSLLLFLYFFYIPRIILDEELVSIRLNQNFYTDNYKVINYKGDIDKNIKIDNNVDNSRVGEYLVKYSIKKGLFNVEKIQKVNVIDDVNPVITLDGDKEINLCNINKFVEQGYSAIDNYDGDITDKVNYIITDKFIYYKVYDSSGNLGEIGRIVHVNDEDKPVISINGNSVVNVILNDEYKDMGAIANDTCDGDITDRIIVSSDVDTSKLGSYTVTYEVSDDFGNKTLETRIVNVVDKIVSDGIIYLTFDDGPGNYTSLILDILKKYNVKATFFVTNNGSDEDLLREYNEGHTIGLHTASHKWSIYSSIDSYYNDLFIVRDRVKRVTGLDAKYIRFPGGSSNTISKGYNKGIMSYLTQDVLTKGYKYFDWNSAVEDAGACSKSSIKDRETCVLNYFKNGLSKKRINMVLLHDIKSYTANSLENMIIYALDNGYSFRAIDDSAPMIHQHVNN